MSNIHISIAAEPITHFLFIPINNSLILSLLVSLGLVLFAFWFSDQTKRKKPTGFFYFIQNAFISLYNFFSQICGEKAQEFFPILSTFFIFILLSNLSGLLPGVGSIGFNESLHGKKVFIPLLRGPTADLNTTLALALLSIVSIQIFGIKTLGFGTYLKKFINLTNPINFFVGILEIFSELSRMISFSLRLFGNIFAGEVLLTVVGFLIPFLAPLPFLGLEIFVGFIQALVFTMLTLVFLSVATSKSH